MLRTLVLILSAAALATAADNPWDKVKALKSGTDIRIIRIASPTPIEAKFDEATDDDLRYVVKNEQKSIHKADIARLDARPKAGSRMTTETKTKNEQPDPTPPVGMNHGPAVAGQSSSSTVAFTGKPAYETIYRRLADSHMVPKPDPKQ